jgi:two-component system LytT family response regulator
MENKIKAIIAEDVEAYLQTIEMLIGEVAPEITIAGKASSLAEADRVIREVKPDLLFLDIQFEEEGATVFDLLDRFLAEGPLPFRVIFITAHLEPGYYARAFDFGALHFLAKPIDKQKLREAIDRVATTRFSSALSFSTEPVLSPETPATPETPAPPGTDTSSDLVRQLRELRQLVHAPNKPGKIVIEGLQFNEVVEIGKIGVLEASGRYTHITLNDGKTYTASQNLGLFEKKLIEFPRFVRIHHNKIINVDYVRRFSRKERNIEMVPPFGSHAASKERFREFLQAIET